MARSIQRVEAALRDAGLAVRIEALGDCRTAADAARACGCALDQIVKSIVFQGEDSGHARLFLTAGGNRVNAELASHLAGETLIRADGAVVRAETGFAIGGVAPVGHLQPVPTWWDRRLSDFPVVWAAAGTPQHVFAAAPADLLRATGAMVTDFTD